MLAILIDVAFKRMFEQYDPSNWIRSQYPSKKKMAFDTIHLTQEDILIRRRIVLRAIGIVNH
jgi:hypothetical protein